MLLRPGEEHKKDHFVTFSLQSPAFDSGGDYELSFNVNMNFVGNIFVVVAQSDSGKSTESQILKITSNRKQKWDLYSIKLPRNSRISVMLEIKFDPDQIDFEHDYIAVNNLNIIDKKPRKYLGALVKINTHTTTTVFFIRIIYSLNDML